MNTQIDGVAAKEFLSLLDLEAKAFTFQTFDDDQSGGHENDRRLARVTSDWTRLRWLYGQGAGAFVTVSETDLKGRGKKNIVRIRAVWQEDDRGFTGKLPLRPSIVVESSPGKFHRYILVAGHWPADEQGIADFDAVLDRMVESYGSDGGAKGINRVLRLPGFLHRKNPAAPFMVHIVKASGARYTREQIMKAFPPVDRIVVARRRARTAAPGARSKYAYGDGGAILQGLVRRVGYAVIGERNPLLNWAAYAAGGHVARGRLEHDHARDALIEIATQIGLPLGEAEEVVARVMGKGQEDAKN